jgi:hypothetical protein
LLKEHWKVITTGLAVLSLASVGLYAIFITRKEARGDNMTFLNEAELQRKVRRAQTLKGKKDWLTSYSPFLSVLSSQFFTIYPPYTLSVF